jgi:hypothetical protein
MAMDVFPASVTIGSLPVIKNCRVRTNDAFDSRVQVWVNRDNKAEMILDMATAQVPQKYNMWAPQQERNAQLILDDPAATLMFVQFEGGCGCGSPLRNLPGWRAMEAEVMVS